MSYGRQKFSEKVLQYRWQIHTMHQYRRLFKHEHSCKSCTAHYMAITLLKDCFVKQLLWTAMARHFAWKWAETTVRCWRWSPIRCPVFNANALKFGCENQSIMQHAVPYLVQRVLRVNRPFWQSVCDLGVKFYMISLQLAHCALFVVARVWNKGVTELYSLQYCECSKCNCAHCIEHDHAQKYVGGQLKNSFRKKLLQH